MTRFLIASGLVLLTTGPAVAGPLEDYTSRIKPLLAERCYACHGVLKQEGGLRLDTAAFAMKGGDSGAAVVAGNVEDSVLWQRVSAKDESERMPPEGEPLTGEQLELLKGWITHKAPAPANESPERDPREHWAFQRPVRPAVPTVQHPDWQANPIDAFLGQQLEQRQLVVQPEADRRVWLRRVSLDLTGLPPTRRELDAFVNDSSPDACDQVVTRLLDSPQYGERWGRHWMDVWRYSDWWGLGAEVRNSQKHMWHWRDWIVESLNEDKGYDQMLREMLAADELYPDDPDRLRAGGFLARHYFKFNRTTWLDGVVEHTSKAMLGLTTNCAKCHDHKYDPISQKDYYQLRAIFEPYQIRLDAVPGELDYEKNGIPRGFDCNLNEPTYIHIRGDDRNPDKNVTLEPTVPAVIRPDDWSVKAIDLPAVASQPGLRDFVIEAHLKQADSQIAAATKTLASAQQQLAAFRTPQPPVDSAITPENTEEPFSDDFATRNPDSWQPREGEWVWTDGKLMQKQLASDRSTLRYLRDVPHEFEARLTFITTGGNQWKSVGITFDVTDSGNEALAYLSAHDGGSKCQVSYKANGQSVYPGNALQPRKVPLNQPQTLLLRVQGNLVNVLINDEMSVAYQLPIARQTGALELITYDATATFLSFSLQELPRETVMRSAGKSGSAEAAAAPVSEEALALKVALAEKSLQIVRQARESILRRSAADKAVWLMSDETAAKTARQAAGQSELDLAVLTAEAEVIRAEQAKLQAGPDKAADSDRNLAKVRVQLAAAQSKAEQGQESYTPIPGALKTLESNVESAESRNRPFPTTSTGRRTALANWLTESTNPLTARVAVNHIWARHMGRPLVETVFDFGRKGAAPTHPALLDWLAVDFMEHGWSMKHLHRLIVTSQAYRRSSTNANADAHTREVDPENRYYWRANPLRMEAQVVRDSLLSIAGQLDLTMGGPSIPVTQTMSPRRGLYFVHSNNDQENFLAMFDDANVLDCYRRAESIVPQQALALENSELALKMSAGIVKRLEAEQPAATDDQFIQAAFAAILSAEPTPEELALVRTTLPELEAAAKTRKVENPRFQARTLLVQALLNHNDFVTIR